ncbi:Fanconi anemia core complex-associated protein 24 isoform X12 [Chelonia mydas]|uniref:Fanconi anemia core complex-associated protein 24 isoform X12 n=1 Tax=Chelonia mydas TaxID=8469 RepID=UPI0018A1C82F|nr:Fanconi anemia core complex-associated protein 24 isoform X12 [Chelonia mydas]
MTAKETTPVKAGAVSVPYGHVIGNEKWRGSQIAQGLQGKIKLILEDGLGLVDFHLSNRSCILYISEADLVAGNGFKRRLVRFRNASSLHGIVIVEKTQISDQYFPAAQKFIVLELGMTLLPVANQGEASQLIIQLPVIKEPAFPVFPQTALREASCGQKTGLLLLESAEMQIKSQSLISFRLRNTLS